MEEIIIAGSGPAGCTAAIYAGRAGLKAVIYSGMEPGGQLTKTTEVDNYPGFPEGIMGPELTDNMIKQAERFGAEVRFADISDVVEKDGVITLTASGKEVQTQSLIIATGSSPRKLGLESEERLSAKGVSYCATCDGFFFKDKVIAVIGGGDSALEEAQFLARFGSTVYIVHRREAFRGSKAMQDKALGKENVKPLYNKVVEDIKGQDKVEAMLLKDTVTGEVEEVAVDGIFVAIGHIPNSKSFTNITETDESGFIKTDPHMHTKTGGVFACGDVVDHYFMQAVTAAGMGCKAGIEAVKYMDELAGTAYE